MHFQPTELHYPCLYLDISVYTWLLLRKSSCALVTVYQIGAWVSSGL